MITTAPILTNAGAAMLAQAAAGATLTFTKFKCGSGTPSGDKKTLTDLVTPKLTFGISETDTSTSNYITLTGSFDSGDISSAFTWTELGVFAKIGTGEEKLYGYCYDANAGTLKPESGDVIAEQSIEMIIAIGDAENVTATITPGTIYAQKSVVDSHIANTSNPHGVTKAQVGLDQVPNVSTNNQTPTYTEATTLAILSSGEKLSTAFGKISKAVSSFIAHLSARNPHGITKGMLNILDALRVISYDGAEYDLGTLQCVDDFIFETASISPSEWIEPSNGGDIFEAEFTCNPHWIVSIIYAMNATITEVNYYNDTPATDSVWLGPVVYDSADDVIKVKLYTSAVPSSTLKVRACVRVLYSKGSV